LSLVILIHVDILATSRLAIAAYKILLDVVVLLRIFFFVLLRMMSDCDSRTVSHRPEGTMGASKIFFRGCKHEDHIHFSVSADNHPTVVKKLAASLLNFRLTR